MVAAERRTHSVALEIEAAQFLAGWHPESGAVFLPALGDAHVGEEVVARIAIAGQELRASLFGTITLVRRRGRPSLPPGVEVVLDPASLPAARFLALAARGEPVTFKERPLRYLFARTVVVRWSGSERQCVTHNISEAGCAIGWTGPLPVPGDVMSVRLNDGLFPRTSDAVVCWTAAAGPPEPLVGLHLVPGGRAARVWRSIVGAVARSSGRTA
jgi:PilZ domain